ncbi:MAG: DegT/DnrJ/EryC1/StrS family aminotransferase, partial [Pseudomonadota bacterium]
MQVPVNTPDLTGNEKKYLLECIDTGWISSEGPFIHKFELGMASAVGRQFGIAVSNGTAALEIAIKALKLGPDDEVIMPTFSIISCSGAIYKAGAKPVLVDCDLDTWNISIDKIEEKITKKTKAIMVVHTYGLPVNMDPIIELAEKYNLKIIEDAAEMHGQTYKDRPCGSFGDISIFSFYPNKHITTGEGGMLVCDSSELAESCRQLRNLCFIPPRRFVHQELGWNYRMTNLQAALGLAQLERLTSFVDKKRRMGERYLTKLSSLEKHVYLPKRETSYARNIYWVFGLVIKPEAPFDVELVMAELGRRGVGTRPFFWCTHEQPVFKREGLFAGENHPNSELIARRG